MIIKLIGAFCIIVTCGGFGLQIAGTYRKEMNTMQVFLRSLDYIACELSNHLTPLAELFRRTSNVTEGILSKVYLRIAEELELQLFPNVSLCVKSAVGQFNQLPHQTKQCVILLADTLGSFDIAGQLQQIDSIRTECRRRLDQIHAAQDNKLRSYQTLGLCAGAALVILFI